MSSHYIAALKLMRSKHPDERKALGLLQKAHRASDRRATYALATWHLFGKAGLPKDHRRAVKLLVAAADAAMPEALFDLAVCYERGQGVAKDARKAARLYLEAAIRGDQQAVFEVGRCYYAGIGVARDRKIANVWFQRAQELNVYDSEESTRRHH